jgi:uncharacterized protein YjbI with pentapeptide repeats
MLNKQENQQATDYSETEQHFKRQECYIPPKNRFARFCKWTGFENKTLWDILNLIGGAAVLGLIGAGINYNFQQHQKYIENERYQQAALENYFKEMTDIIVEKKLGTLHHVRTEKQKLNEQDPISQSIALLEKLEPNNTINQEQKKMIVGILNEIRESQLQELKAIARAQTLTTLNLLRLDKERRDLLLNFLRETTLAAKNRACFEQNNKSEICDKEEKEANLLIGINLANIQLSEFNLELFILKQADLNSANLSQVRFSEADLSGSNLNRSNLSQALMNGTQLKGAKLKYANLTNADLTNAKLEPQKPDLTNVNLKPQNTDLTNANLTNANLTNANLTNANLTNANLTNADLTNADLTNADLTNADLTNANLTNANLTNANLNNGTPSSLKSQYARAELVKHFPNTHFCNTTMPNKYKYEGDCNQPWKKRTFCIIKRRNLVCIFPSSITLVREDLKPL